MATRFADYSAVFADCGTIASLDEAQRNTYINYWRSKGGITEHKGGGSGAKRKKSISIAPDGVRAYTYDNTMPSNTLDSSQCVVSKTKIRPHLPFPSVPLFKAEIMFVTTICPWFGSPVGTRAKLLDILSSQYQGLTIEQLREDMRMVYWKFYNGRNVIVHYKHSIKITPDYAEQVPIFGTI